MHRLKRGTRLHCRLIGVALALSILGAGASETRARDSQDFQPWSGRTISEIRIQGNRVTRDYVITREILSEPGQPLDPELLRSDVTRLENLSIFGSVEVHLSEEDEQVAIDFVFSEMPSLVPFPALTWNEENGFSFGLGLTSPNLNGRGISLSTRAVFGGTTNYNFRGANPWIMGDHLSAEVLVYHNERENRLLEFAEDTDRVEITVGYYIGKYGRMSGNIGYWGVKSDRDGITLDDDLHDNMLLIGGKVGFDSRDSWRTPHRGWRGEITSAWLGGDASTQTTSVDVRRYQPISARQTLAFGPLYSVQSGEVGAEIPRYQQYFLGGSNSVRGYDLVELGRQLYGKNRLLGSVEYRFLLLRVQSIPILRWSVAVGLEIATFADAGVVWSEASEFNLDRTRFGYGAGIRALLPVVEMARFDIGISETGDVVFNFGIRSMFEARSLPTF
jgi:outer membrane protein insertion porin family